MLVSFWHCGTGLSFVALFLVNIGAVAGGFKFVFEKARNGPFINGLNNQVYEGSYGK